MRDILFRGKRLDNGKFAEGDLSRFPNGTVRINPHEQGQPWLGYEVNPETICQYTGLTDKNGVKIFEGDIVKYQFDNDDCPYPNKRTEKIIGRIFFSEFRASFSVTDGENGSKSMNNDLFKYVRNGNRVEVIGNIYDSPELLE